MEPKETSIKPTASSKPNSDNGLAGVLGDITLLMMGSKGHRHMFIADLEWAVMPALMSKQMRIFRNEQRPLAYISWAFLSEEAEKRLLSGQGRIAPRDWKSGDRAWIIDSITAGKNSLPLLRTLQEEVFKDQPVHLFQPKKDRNGWEGVLLGDILKK